MRRRADRLEHTQAARKERGLILKCHVVEDAKVDESMTILMYANEELDMLPVELMLAAKAFDKFRIDYYWTFAN